MPLFRKSPAQVAGRKAARSWQTILEQTGESIYDLTGRDLYAHAQAEARKWLRSEHRIPYQPDPHIIGADPAQWFDHPEQRYHQEFLDYVEAFMAAFPPRIKGYPKD
jgi:hypothetical protein